MTKNVKFNQLININTQKCGGRIYIVVEFTGNISERREPGFRATN